MRRWILVTVVVCAPLAAIHCTVAADWPAWRHDANRSAATTEQLPEELHLQWSWKLDPLKPAWPEDTRLHFDAHYEPVVAGDTMFVSSSRNHSVTAIATKTGEQRWRFHADGPVRFAPAVWSNNVYFGADDGCLYCLDAATGETKWKFNGAPSNRLSIGNERLISVWPARSGPVVVNRRVYFTVGIWPFEGTLLYAVDAETGAELSVTDLPDQSPHGYLAANREHLFIPCGRSLAYVLNHQTGERVPLSYDSKGKTDFHVVATDKHLFHGDLVLELGEGKPRRLVDDAHRPVISGGQLFFAAQGEARAYDLDDLMKVEKKDRRGETVEIKVARPLWRMMDVPVTRRGPGTPRPITKVHLKAGNRVYAHHAGAVMAIDVAESSEARPRLSWRGTVEGTPATMLAANGKLFVVTKEGSIHCFGEGRGIAKVWREEPRDLAGSNAELVQPILSETSTDSGYCLVVGIGDGVLIDALVQKTNFHVFAIGEHEQRVAALRKRMDASGVYGDRVSARVGSLKSLRFPPYFANLAIVRGVELVPEDAQRIFHVLRPYGGVACLQTGRHGHLAKTVSDAGLQNAELSRSGNFSVLRRVGALQGTSDWTHEYGDPANSLTSKDTLVKTPLGVLWFGGPSSDGNLYFDRHAWPPSATIIGGRMFLQGPNTFTAVDVYTGRILWKVPVSIGLSPGRRAEWRPSGYHFVAKSDGIYLAFPSKCVRLDPATGDVVSEFELADRNDTWGRFRIVDEKLIVPVFRPTGEPQESLPSKLVALDRNTGEVLWSKSSEDGFPLIAIGNDKVFCFEGKLDGLYTGMSKQRRGGVPVATSEKLRIKALDLNTGNETWSKATRYAGSWLAYSEAFDVVLMSNRNGISAMTGTDGAELWRRQSTGEGFKGHPENYWDRVIVWNDRIIDQRGPGKSYDVLTGDPITKPNPITGEEADWQFTKIGHHCNYAIANEHLMTFRAAGAGFCDIESGETGRLNGFRPGCRNSLIPADGVLNAPNFGYGCTCSYSLFTSLALVHVPDSNFWTYSKNALRNGSIERLGINFGAPGDRRAKDGTMWLEHPNVDGASRKINVRVEADSPKYFRLHPSQIDAQELNWVAASGVEGVSRITIPVAVGGAEPEDRTYSVRFWFAEPKEDEGQRVFDVSLQGKKVLDDFDIRADASSARRAILKDFPGVQANEQIVIDFSSERGAAIVSGIEVVAE